MCRKPFLLWCESSRNKEKEKKYLRYKLKNIVSYNKTCRMSKRHWMKQFI